MYVSFTKYVSTVPGVCYQGYDGLKEIYDKNNTNNDGSLIVPADRFDATIYKNFIDAMTEFKEKPNGIVSYLAKSNNYDLTYTVTLFSSMEDFLAIAQSSWFEDYSAKRAAYLELVGIQTYLRNVERIPSYITLDSTFDDVGSHWDQLEVIIA